MSGTAITAVTGQIGETARLISWIQEAHETIQLEYFDWFFLWKQATLSTVATESVIDSSNASWPTDVNIWGQERFYISDNPLTVEEYSEYEPGDSTSGQPTKVFILPDNTLKLSPTPDAVYSIAVDYYQTPKTLTATTDEPLIPSRFGDRAIVGLAMTYYGLFEPAPEVLQRGQAMYDEAMRQMRNHQLAGRQNMVALGSPNIIVRPE